MHALARLQRAFGRLVLGLATLVVGLANPAPSLAQNCIGDPKPYIYIKNPIFDVHVDSGLTRDFAKAVARTVNVEFAHALAGRVTVVAEEDFINNLAAASQQMMLSADTVGNSILLNEVVPQSAIEWLLRIRLIPIAGLNQRQMVLTLIDTTARRRADRSSTSTLPSNNAAVGPFLVNEVRTFARGLDCELRLIRGAPVRPQVRIAVEPTPPRGQPGDTLTVRATLVDLANNAAPVPNQRLTVYYLTPQGDLLSRWATTDANGVATDRLVLGPAHPRAGLIEAGFRDLRGVEGKSQKINYYVRPAGGQLNLTAGKAQLPPTGGDTVNAELRHNANPVPSASINLSASAGAVGSASVITSSAGLAAVPYVAPNAPSLVDLHASATLPAGAGTATASVSYVVDPGVVMSLAAGGDTVVFGASSLRVDLEREQRAVSGATVEFSVVGGGALSAATATTDSVGRAEALFSAPSRAGTSTVTARVALDGQTYTRSVTVRYSDPFDALTREIADVKEAMWLNPSDATLRRLNTLRGALLARGETSRAESLLGDRLVSSPLTCVHQRAHDECAAGLRTKGEATLGLVKGIVRGSQVLDYLVGRARDSLRICPYPALAAGVYVPAATLNDIVFTHALGLNFNISGWGSDDRPSHFFFDARDETGTINRFVRGTVRVSGAGPTYSTTIDDGDMFNLWGNRFQMLLYQRAATTPTVSVSVIGTQVSGSIQLYQGDYEGSTRTATLSFSTTVTLPPAPTMSCTNNSLPSGD